MRSSIMHEQRTRTKIDAMFPMTDGHHHLATVRRERKRQGNGRNLL